MGQLLGHAFRKYTYWESGLRTIWSYEIYESYKGPGWMKGGRFNFGDWLSVDDALLLLLMSFSKAATQEVWPGDLSFC